MATLKILIVEDEAITASNIEEQLLGFGYTVTCVAYNSTDAIESFNKMRPDLAIVDINLENSPIDGIEVVEKFNTVHRIPIVYLTARKDIETRQRAKKTNPINFLTKPYTENQLEAAIDMAVDVFTSESMFEDDYVFIKDETSYSKKLLTNRVVFHRLHGVFELVCPDDIVYCESFGDTTRVFQKGYKQDEKKEDVPTFTAMRNIGFYAKRLIRDFDFFRVSNQLLLNLNYLKSYNHNERELKLTDGRSLLAARRKGRSLKDYLNEE